MHHSVLRGYVASLSDARLCCRSQFFADMLRRAVLGGGHGRGRGRRRGRRRFSYFRTRQRRAKGAQRSKCVFGYSQLSWHSLEAFFVTQLALLTPINAY